jgi:hypothetical protein
MKLILGLNDLQTTNNEITDPRFVLCSVDPDDEYVWNSVAPVPLPVPRPHETLVTAQEIEREMRTNAIRAALSERPWYKVFHWNGEYGDPAVCGCVLKEGPYDDDFFYALMLLHPAYATDTGHQVLPSEDLDRFDASPGGEALHTIRRLVASRAEPPIRTLLAWCRSAETDDERWYRKEMLAGAARKNRLIRWGFNLRWWTHRIEADLATAQWVFQQAGFRVDVRDLKLMLYWQWS